MILINTITIIKIIILVKHLGAFYILGSLDDRFDYLYSYKLLFLIPTTGSILWTLATKEKLQMQIMFNSRLGKNYDKVDDEIVFYFLFFIFLRKNEWWNCCATKTKNFSPEALHYSILYSFNESVVGPLIRWQMH